MTLSVLSRLESDGGGYVLIDKKLRKLFLFSVNLKNFKSFLGDLSWD